jgi:hypothetical protein
MVREFVIEVGLNRQWRHHALREVSGRLANVLEFRAEVDHVVVIDAGGQAPGLPDNQLHL